MVPILFTSRQNANYKQGEKSRKIIGFPQFIDIPVSMMLMVFGNLITLHLSVNLWVYNSFDGVCVYLLALPWPNRETWHVTWRSSGGYLGQVCRSRS